MTKQNTVKVLVIISANAEWQVIRTLFPNVEPEISPLGEWFSFNIEIGEHKEPVVFFHGGWGKIAAAASAQYVIDRWTPTLLVNLGTCGGFEGEIEKGTIILVERTIVYDITEMMSDYDAAIAHYTIDLDLSWLGENYPHPVHRALLVSGDRDLQIEDIPHLKTRFGAVAGDWESGAIAYVAARNNVRCLILRGVTDLVGASGGEAYGKIEVFVESTTRVMSQLVAALPEWIGRAM